MPLSLRIRLSAMMFLNYFVWGCWYVTLGTYLTTTLKFSGTQAGAVFGTTAVASMISPFFVGLIADRYFATERVMLVLHLVGAGILYAVTRVTGFGSVYGLMLLYCLCYFPTIALTNSIVLRSVKDSGRDFPLIRFFGTFGWIAIGLIIGWLRIETSSAPFLLAAGSSLVMAVFCLMLPHMPPQKSEHKQSLSSLLGFDALVMLKSSSYRIFVIASVLACIPLTFYFSFTNAYLNDVGVVNAAGKMTWGQISEVGMMLSMPFIFRRFTVKGILLMGLVAWSIRYVLLAVGNAGDRMWMFYVAILLHGICYDFFFMTGQLYTDQQAPAHLRNAAQGFITFLTYGVGMFFGSLLSGGAVDLFTTKHGDTITRNWQGFWLSSSLGAFVLVVLITVFFRSKGKIESRAEA
jgi:nucleoside transporter